MGRNFSHHWFCDRSLRRLPIFKTWVVLPFGCGAGSLLAIYREIRSRDRRNRVAGDYCSSEHFAGRNNNPFTCAISNRDRARKLYRDGVVLQGWGCFIWNVYLRLASATVFPSGDQFILAIYGCGLSNNDSCGLCDVALIRETGHVVSPAARRSPAEMDGASNKTARRILIDSATAALVE